MSTHPVPVRLVADISAFAAKLRAATLATHRFSRQLRDLERRIEHQRHCPPSTRKPGSRYDYRQRCRNRRKRGNR